MTGRKLLVENEYMRWGVEHEHRGVDAVELKGGILYSKTGKRQRSQFLDAEGYRLRATPDGLYTHEDGSRSGLEVKCPLNLHDDPRQRTICQVQFQAFVCDLEFVTVIEWSYQGHRAWRVEHSSDYIRWAMPKMDEFVRFLRDDEEPPKLGKAPEPPSVKVELLFEELKSDIAF